MNLEYQTYIIEELRSLAESDKHSVLIDGVRGCGKTYLAKQYAALLGISDFYILSPNVQSVRDTIDSLYNVSSKVVICVENLDSGAVGASYALLKFLEEPAKNVYVVVTCQNRYKVPDTIISRSACISVPAPSPAYLSEYAQIKNASKYNQISKLPVWRAVRSFKDVDNVYQMSDSQLSYYDSLPPLFDFKDNVSNIVWKLQHYSDDSETDPVFVMNFLLSSFNSSAFKRKIIECVRDLSFGNIAVHAVLSKFVLDCKYGD